MPGWVAMQKKESDKDIERKSNSPVFARISGPLTDWNKPDTQEDAVEEKEESVPAHTTATYWG